jgi:arginine-tRNA-protein transferase
MLVLHAFTTDPHTCPYLHDRQAQEAYSFAATLDPQEYEDLMNQGYRKFGAVFFKPVCDGCNECRPIRVPVDRFTPDRSQRRAWKQNADLEIRCGLPVGDAQRVALYNRYHEARTREKGWPPHPTDEEEYELSFVCNPVPAVEISAWANGTLKAVILTDITPRVVSAVYHIYDPADEHRGLGTFCVLQTIELARRLGKQWVYLGFYVAGCSSMTYKARFRPCEIMGPDGVWRAQP